MAAGGQERRQRLWRLGLAGTVGLGVFAYGYGLTGLYIPNIGDESPYIAITRLTAASGHWLPLRTPEGLENTKPPLLFWLGIASTEWGRHFTLGRLRAPLVVTTFLVAALVFLLTRRLSGSEEAAWAGAAIYLGFHASFQYGRPFLTNAPETLFMFLPVFLLLRFRDHWNRWVLWWGAGLALGMACLFKSFALVAPLGLALAAWMVHVRSLRLGDVCRVALTLFLGLGVFLLWPLADPDPTAILRHFVLEENLGKLSNGSYVEGLFTGAYPLYRIWLGVPLNAGLYALPVVYLAWTGLARYEKLTEAERLLFLFVLAFLVVYSLPSQRQENYLIPVMPAVAVLLALKWKEIPIAWVRASLVPVAVVAALLVWAMVQVGGDVLPPGAYRPWQWLVVGGVLGISLFALAAGGLGRLLLPPLVLAAYFGLSCALAPFQGILGHFAPEQVERLRGRRVYVPSPRLLAHEKHRFLLPGARIVPYDPADVKAVNRLLERGASVVVRRPIGFRVQGPFRVLARRYHLRSRQSFEEMASVVRRGDFRALVEQELVLRRYRGPRLREGARR